MSATGLKVFDTTLQETNHWLQIVMGVLETADRRLAFDALRGVLHAVRDRLGPEVAVKLGAQLPMLLRGAYYEGWKLSNTPTAERHSNEFLMHVQAALPRGADVAPEKALSATLAAMEQCLDPGEVNKIRRLLPKEIQALFAELMP